MDGKRKHRGRAHDHNGSSADDKERETPTAQKKMPGKCVGG
jgi:hypothetical protein